MTEPPLNNQSVNNSITGLKIKGNTDGDSFGKNTVGAAQAAATPERKVSKLYSNSFEKTPLFNEAEKNAAHLRRLDKTYSYDEITEKRSLQEAAIRIQTDKAGELADLPVKGEWGGSDVDTAMLLMEDMLKTARQTKNYDEVLKWTKMIQEKATVAGQEIQAFAKYSRTPEGAVVKAQKVAADQWKKLEKSNPKLAKQATELADMLKKYAKGGGVVSAESAQSVLDIKKAMKKLAKHSNTELDDSALDKILQMIQEKHNGGFDIDRLTKQLAGVPEIDANDAKQIIEIMEEAQKFPVYSKRRADIEAKAYAVAASKLTTSWAEKCTAWRYMAMLGNPRTHIRNTLGNFFFGELTKTKSAVGALLEEATDRASKGVAKLTKSGEGGIQRTKAIPCGIAWGAANNKQLRTDMVKAFLDVLQGAGYYAGLYASTDWLLNWVFGDQLTDYDKWVAQYASKCAYPGKYGMWQHHGDAPGFVGQCDGISGAVDLNDCYKDYPGIIKAAGLNNWPKTGDPVSPPMEQKPDYEALYYALVTDITALIDKYKK